MRASLTKMISVVAVALVAIVVIALLFWLRRSASDEPGYIERTVARRVRNWSIPRAARQQTNPWSATPENLQQAREVFIARCSVCHGYNGTAQTQVGRALYPKPPDLRRPPTQHLIDGEIHYIIQNGVRLTGMPAWSTTHAQPDEDSWKLVLFIRQIQQPSAPQLQAQTQSVASAHYVGSQACAKCHSAIYERWKKTPMANIVRDPREHPEAIIPDLATNNVAKFTKDQVAFVYGSIWKQRYFTKQGDDYFPLGAQWDVTHRKWLPYFVKNGTDLVGAVLSAR